MFDKKFLIILLAAIIIMGFLTFSITKPEVSLDLSAQHIPGTSEIYLVCKIIDNHGNIADTPYGKLTLELLDENGSGVVYDEIPIQHGILIMRHDREIERVNAHYDGSYIYKPSDFSGKIQIENTTTLSDENITGWH